jgi:outer membrane protein assembly factor BamB
MPHFLTSLAAGTVALLALGANFWSTDIVTPVELTFPSIFGDEPIPPSTTTTPSDLQSLPKDTSALGGYNVLIADRGNNRIIEVNPDKQIIWEYDFKNLPAGYAADDSFFTDGGKTVIVNLEYYHLIEQIDYQTKKVTWQYGTPGKHGSSAGYLYSPDDAYKLPNGDVIVADIKNCRVIEISPDKKIVHQYGKTRQCSPALGFLNSPNGDTPLPNGHILISNIESHNLIELDSSWNQVFSMPLPLAYPSDPQLMKSGNTLIADYTNPGKIIEITRQGQVVWQYTGDGTTSLKKPSLAIELPNGNILSNDDLNHRVIVIDKNTKQIIWQYGVTGKPGIGVDQLNTPDGLDIIKIDPAAASTTTSTSLNTSMPIEPTIGTVTRHPAGFIGKELGFYGYLLKAESGYGIFSDESTGTISSFDLPVSGAGVDAVIPGHKYLLQGTFLDQGLAASNGSIYHLELLAPPKP